MVNRSAPDDTRLNIARANRTMDEAFRPLNQVFNQRQPPPPPGPVPAGTGDRPRRYARDHGREGFYDAERRLRRVLDRQHEFPIAEVAGSRITLPVERKFASVPSVQAYVDLVQQRRWPEFPRLGMQRLAVETKPDHTGQDHAVYTGGRILVPVRAVNPATGTRWAMRELVVLHEVAHHAVAVHHPAGEISAHGPEFAGAFRTLLIGMMGPEMSLLFDVVFREAGVRVA